MNATLKTPHYRIEHPTERLAVEFVCEKSTVDAAPKIFARLTHPARATIFASHQHAAECFARYLAGQALEIVRADA